MTNKKTTGITFIILLIISIVLLVKGNDGTNTENRATYTMPEFTRKTFLSGEFSTGTENFLNDHISNRNELIEISQQVVDFMGIESPAGKVIRSDMDLGTGVKQSSDLLVANYTIMEMFAEQKSCAQAYTKAVNSYAEKLSDDIKLYLMLVPTQLEFMEPMYSNLQDSQLQEIKSIYSSVSDRVQTINVYDVLKSHSDEYIYFRTDHHWTMRGAYYAYASFCEQTNQEYVDANTLKRDLIPGFIGYLYAFAKTKELAKYPDVIEWFNTNEAGNMTWKTVSFDEDNNPFVYDSVLFDKTHNNYDFFLGADHPLACYTNNNLPDGKTIIVICDSYANAFAPWLMNNYKNVVLINPRSYSANLSYAIETYKPDEVMVLNYIFTTSFNDFCEKLLNLY